MLPYVDREEEEEKTIEQRPSSSTSTFFQNQFPSCKSISFRDAYIQCSIRAFSEGIVAAGQTLL